MPIDSELEFALDMAKAMLEAGARHLQSHDPEKDDALQTVARIYYAMEGVREEHERRFYAEHAETMPPLDKSKLN